jgi:hypothetical protein
VANAIVAALEQAAERLGKTLSKDAGSAVERMYRDAGTGVEKVVKNIKDADDEHASKFLELAEKAGQNEGKKKLSAGAQRRQNAVENYVHRVLDPDNAADHDYEVTIDSKKYPESAQHIQEAQAGTIWRGDVSTQGQPVPSVLTVGRDGADANRDVSLSGIETREGQDRDEVPPAMFQEGGHGASVKYIDSSDNQGAGASVGNQLRGLPEGTRVKITVK